jgi:EmrB/QacA subfamily drug resistance transporter
MIIFTLSSFLSGISISAPMLIVFRVIQGIGSAMIFATGIAILTSIFPLGERGKVLGINVAAVYIGLSLGPSLGGFLTQHFTWRSIFLMNVALGIVAIYLIVSKLKGEWAEARGERFDLIGTSIYGFALVAIMYGISSLPSTRSVWLILLGLFGIVAFIRWEMATETPVFEVSLFKTNRVFAFSSMAALIHYSATFAVSFLLSLYLQHIRGLSPQGAGLVLISQPIVMAIFSPFAGRLSDRIEPRIVASLGMTLTAIGLFLFTLIDEKTALPFVVGRLLLIGFGFALFSSPNTNAIMSSVERRFYGVASGSVGTMRLLGQMLSMGIATLLFAVYIGRVQITEELYPLLLTSVRVAFIIFCALSFGGVFASLARGNVRADVANAP